MPSRRTFGISSHSKLTIMVLLGTVRNMMNLFSFTWNGNVQKVWNLPGPEPSFTVQYHFDYWLKNVLSLVVLFRNFTTHLHLVFYIVMLYPLLTGERHRFMVPWLYLQLLKNIVTDVICTVVGVLMCWTLHSCGLMLLEFIIVRIISMMPSIYLWRRLRSYYFDLYYAELDADYTYPTVKAVHPLTLAERRRATKSLDGTVMATVTSSDSRSRINSCVTYEEFFGPPNWEEDGNGNKTSKSLTTLLTMESEESDDIEEESFLNIIDVESLTPAEKTLRILGITREEADATNLQLSKKTSTNDVRGHRVIDVDSKSSLFSVNGETVGPRTVGMQVRPARGSKSKPSDSSEERRTQNPKKCACCEETKCSKEEESDSDEKRKAADSLSGRTSSNCCDKSRAESAKRHGSQNIDKKKRDEDNADDAEARVSPLRSGNNSGTASPPYKNQENQNNSHHVSRLQAVVERDGIVWDNLKEINFVSVINKALCNETKPFKLQRDRADGQRPIVDHVSEESDAGFEWNSREIIPEGEDGTRIISRSQASWNLLRTSASFGVDSGILALNASRVFEEPSTSRPDRDISIESHFESSFQRHSNMFDDSAYRMTVKNSVHYDFRDFETGNGTGIPEKPLRDSEGNPKNQRIISGEKILEKNCPTDRRSLTSSSRSSRSSKTRKTVGEREAKTMQALKAYNEKTLLKYKREMDQGEFRYHLSKQDQATSFGQDLYISLPPEEELISKIEKAYARFTRSKPPTTNFEVLRENRSSKKFFEIYSGVERPTKVGNKNEVKDDERGLRKQQGGGVKRNESYETSMTRKIIEGSKKGRELERTAAMENIRVQKNVQQVYFFDQQVDDGSSTSKNSPIITIKYFPRQLNETVSSEVLTTMVEVLGNPEEIPLRIEDSEYYRQLRDDNLPRNVEKAMKNIDWSFRALNRTDNHRHGVCITGAEVVGLSANQGQDIVEKTTEKLLEIAFANGENSERGFRLGESEDEFYPIFNNVVIAIEEIVRAAGRRGYIDEFISQPGREVEIADIEEADLYGFAGQVCQLTRRSSYGDIRVLKKLSKKEELTSVTTSTAPVIVDKKLETPLRRDKDSLDQDENVFIHDDEEAASLLSRLITSGEPGSAEINIPVIGPEDVPEEPEDASGKIQSPKIRDLESGWKNGFRPFEIDVASCQKILDRFDTGEAEMQRMIVKILDQFDSSGDISLRGSDFITVLKIVTNLHEIGKTAEEIISAEEGAPTRDSGNSESRSTSGTSGTCARFENVSANTSTGSNNPGIGRRRGDRDNEDNYFGRRVVTAGDKSNPDSATSSSEKMCKPKKLLSNISNTDSVSLTRSEILRREDFRRKVISSAFVQAVKQSSDKDRKDTQVRDETFTLNLDESEDEVPELWVTDDEQTPRITMDETICLTDVASDAMPDVVLREIEIADHAIKRIKTVFERFSKEQKKNRGASLEIDSKVSFLMNFRFPVNRELRKLQNLVQTVANYTTIVGGPSTRSIGRNENLKKIDSPDAGISVPKSRSLLKNSQGHLDSRNNTERFSSWDKIIPLSTRREMAKNRRKIQLKKVQVSDREPPRRVVKVVKLMEEKELDFFSARSIPQRGRGLSSGYLMDSDSDGNFTVSRPLTPVSVDSTTSLNSLLTNEESKSDSTDRPIEPCRGSASENRIQEMKSDDRCTQNALRDEELDVLGTKSILPGNYLENMKSVDAAGIENKLKDVVQLILRHQFRGNGPSTNEVRGASCSPEVDVEQKCDDRMRETFDTPVEHLIAHCRDSESMSGNTEAVSFHMAQRRSRYSLRDVAMGTECTVEVFEELLDVSEKIHSTEKKMIPEKNDDDEGKLGKNLKESSEKEELEPPNRLIMTSSYDSYVSNFSRSNFAEFPDQSCRRVSISNHTYFEEFEEQVDGNFQSNVEVDAASSESTKTEHDLQGKDDAEDFREESSFANLAVPIPGSSKADPNLGKNPSPKKKGIPRLIRGSKDQR